MNKLKKTVHYLLRYKLYSAAIVFFIVIGAGLEGFSAGMIIPFLQSIISPGENIFSAIPVLNKFITLSGQGGGRQALPFLMLFIFTLVLLKNIFIVSGKILIRKLRCLLFRDLQNDLFDRLILAGTGFFDGVKAGQLIHSFNRETELIAGYMFNFLNLTAVSFQMAVYCLLLFFISWQLSALSILLIFLIFPIMHFIRRKNEEISFSANRDRADASVVLWEALSGIRVIKLFIAEKLIKRFFKKSVNKFVLKEYRSYVWQELITPVSEVFILGLITIIFIKVIFSFSIDLSRALPLVITFMWVLLRLVSQLNNFNHFRTEMAGSIGAFDSYESFLGKIEGSILPEGGTKICHFKEKIEFRDVGFGYGKNKAVLRNFNLVIPKGKIIGVVGSSGGGKTTIVNLISRLYDVTSGGIFVDGIDLREFDSHSWRRRIGFVPQEVFIFNASVKDNVAFGLPQVSEEEVISAAKTANIHEFIISLSEGYGTILGERGVRLSGGQKQRVSIARAVIRNPDLLILDEATSSLDTESERLIQDAIGKICRNRTVIIIAHRLSTIQNADRLFVVENGRIVESGTHNQLLRSGGRYSKLYNL